MNQAHFRRIIRLLLALPLFLTRPVLSEEPTTQPAAANAGDPAPDFAVYPVDADNDAAPLTLKDFAGKPLILEFWATWCGPCRPASKHLAQLYNEIGGDRIAIVSVSTELKGKVRAYLRDHPVPFMATLSKDKNIFKDYCISGIPHAALIDKAGKLVWCGNPIAFTNENLTALVDGEPFKAAYQSNCLQKHHRDAKKKEKVAAKKAKEHLQIFLAEIEVFKTDIPDKPMWGPTATIQGSISAPEYVKLQWRATQPAAVLTHLLDVRPARVDYLNKMAEEYYEVMVRVARDDAVVNMAAAAPLICNCFDLETTWIERSVAVEILTVVDEDKLASFEGYQSPANDLANLSKRLEYCFDAHFVLDDGQPSGLYEIKFDFKCKEKPWAEVKPMLLEKYGISSRTEQRTLRFLQITNLKPNEKATDGAASKAL